MLIKYNVGWSHIYIVWEDMINELILMLLICQKCKGETIAVSMSSFTLKLDLLSSTVENDYLFYDFIIWFLYTLISSSDS